MNLENNKLVPIEYRLGFDEQEIKTLKLIKYYEILRRRICKEPRYMLISTHKDPRQSRFFESFKKLISQQSLIPNPKLFILAQFEILKMDMRGEKRIHCPPAFLFSKHAWVRYKTYINQIYFEKNTLKIKDINISDIIKEIKKTHKFIKQYNLNNLGKNEFNFKTFILNENNWIYLTHQVISFYFLSISKTFSSIDLSKIPKQFTSELPDNLDIYRKTIYNNKELFEIAKDLFGDEINDN